MKNMKANTLGNSNIRTPEEPPKKRNKEIATGKEKEKLDMLTPSGRSSSLNDQGNKLQSSEKPVILNKGKEKMIESPPEPKYVWRTVPVGFQTKGISIGSPPISLPPEFRNAMFSFKSNDKPPVTKNAMVSTISKDKPPATKNAMISPKSIDKPPVTENAMNSTKSKDKTPVNQNAMISSKSKDKPPVNENAMISINSKDKPPVNTNAKISTNSKNKAPVNENAMSATKSKDKAPVNENERVSAKSKDKTPTEVVRTESKTPKRRNTRQKTVDAPTSGKMISPQDVVDAGMHLNPARKEHYAWFSLTPSSDQNKKDTLQLLVQPYLQITMDGECDPDVSILMKYIVLQLKHVCQAEVGIFMNGKLLDPEMKLLDVVNQWTTVVGSERKITKIGSSAENFCVKLTYARRE